MGKVVSPKRGTTEFGYDGTQEIFTRSGGYTKTERVQSQAGQMEVTYNTASNPTLKFVHYDSLGNVALVTSTSGSVLADGKVDLYGTNASNTDEFNFLGSSGYRNRSSSGIYQVGYRA